MHGTYWWLIIGILIGIVIGVLVAASTLFCIRYQKNSTRIGICSRTSQISLRRAGVDTNIPDSETDPESPPPFKKHKRKNTLTFSGIPRYLYKDLQRATHNFTTIIGHGAFGTVYKAQMATGETLAVKVLASNSKQGEKEFQSEVVLLGRLHHRNLVNLVGYCTEKGKHMLIYVYMTNGNLASHLYSQTHEPLSWNMRIYIALDVARGLEYLHDGAIPPIVHRDIKSSNILLDSSMRARVADFGLSKEVSHNASNIKGTYGYLDPEYISSRKYTEKSDVYSFGVLLFELITARNPQQGLMDYVELATMRSEGKSGWEEIVDPRLQGKYNIDELNYMSTLAYRCIKKVSRRRPRMREVVQYLSKIAREDHIKKRQVLIEELESRENHMKKRQVPIEDLESSIEFRSQNSISDLERQESSVGSTSDFAHVL